MMEPITLPDPRGMTKHEYGDALIRFNFRMVPRYLSLGFPLASAECLYLGSRLFFWLHLYDPVWRFGNRFPRIGALAMVPFRTVRLLGLGVKVLFLTAAVRVRDFCKGRKL